MESMLKRRVREISVRMYLSRIKGWVLRISDRKKERGEGAGGGLKR